jgi:ATP-dependent Lhr-like helicase
MWPLDQLISGRWPLGSTSVLYVSPLKALNNDIQRNLLVPLAELQSQYTTDGVPWYEPKVMPRSGDTSATDRRRMQRHPPEILITTPESLNLLLSSVSGRGMLQGIRMVILDEIHAVLDSKRDTHLSTAIKRLAHLTGEFQRNALSATVHPIQPVARFIGGFDKEKNPRPVLIVQPPRRKKIHIAIERTPYDPTPWQTLAPRRLEIIDRNRSIDIGTVDEVVLIQAPHSVASATQRIGRDGRRP